MIERQKLQAAKKTSAKEASAHKRPRPQSLILTDNDRVFNAQTGSASRDTNIPKKPRLDITPVKASGNSHSGFLPQAAIDKNHLPNFSFSTFARKPVEPVTPKRYLDEPNTPMKINSFPLVLTNKTGTALSSHKDLYSTEFKEIMLTEYRKIEEKLAASAERKKKLQDKILAYQTRAEMERKAAEAGQRGVEVEERIEASLRGVLGHFEHFIG